MEICSVCSLKTRKEYGVYAVASCYVLVEISSLVKHNSCSMHLFRNASDFLTMCLEEGD